MVIPSFSLKYQLNRITFCIILLYKHKRVKQAHTEKVSIVVQKIMIIISEMHQLSHDTKVFMNFLHLPLLFPPYMVYYFLRVM